MIISKKDLTEEEEKTNEHIKKVAGEISMILLEETDGNLVSMLGLIELVKANILESARK